MSKTQISQKSIESRAKLLEEMLTAFGIESFEDEKVQPLLEKEVAFLSKDIQLNINSVVKTATEGLVKKEPTPTPQDEQKNAGGVEPKQVEYPDEIKEALAYIKQTRERDAVSSIKSTLKQRLIDELNCNSAQEKLIDKVIKMHAISSDSDIESLVETTKEGYNELISLINTSPLSSQQQEPQGNSIYASDAFKRRDVY